LPPSRRRPARLRPRPGHIARQEGERRRSSAKKGRWQRICSRVAVEELALHGGASFFVRHRVAPEVGTGAVDGSWRKARNPRVWGAGRPARRRIRGHGRGTGGIEGGVQLWDFFHIFRDWRKKWIGFKKISTTLTVFSHILPPSIYPSPICTWLKDQGKEIKYLQSLISGEACERYLLLTQMPKRRFSVFQCKNTNGALHKWNFQISK
jgi:hypothetical protein